jgi:hypothetical protein
MLKKPDPTKPGFAFMSNAKKNIEEGRCVFCENAIQEEDFNSEEDKQEYTISGMCQNCIDQVFAEEAEYSDVLDIPINLREQGIF